MEEDKSNRLRYMNGYREEHFNGRLMTKGNYINGVKVGYWERYYYSGVLNYKEYFVV